MPFQMKYKITPMYLTTPSKRRSGIKMPKVRFVVAHDTGNAGSTARGNVRYYENSRNQMSASAHIFVDDKEIIECIPALTGTPEKAWHVMYDKPIDNQLFGDDANDVAIGIELCYGGKINNEEAYKRYVWVLAYTCYKFNLNPAKHITGHFILDPKRKTDPENALKKMGKSFKHLINDVVKEYNKCLSIQKLTPQPKQEKVATPTVQSQQNKQSLQEVMGMKMSDFVNNHNMKQLEEIYKKAHEEGLLNDNTWAEKAANKTITVGEVAFLATILDQRRFEKYCKK